jgi:hypothetical protein
MHFFAAAFAPLKFHVAPSARGEKMTESNLA